MSRKYILSIDQSTSGTKALVVNDRGEIIQKVSKSHKQIYPREGWVEHDPVEIYENVKKAINQIAKTYNISDFAVLSVTNQRETVVLWDKDTGLPVYNAIVWQCRRTTDMCEQLKAKGIDDIIHEKTGLTIDPYFSATKIKWIIDFVPEVKEKIEQEKILFGTIDSWLIWKLTNGRVHATDYSNASRTLLFNIQTLGWDEELLNIFGINKTMLPDVKSSDDVFGRVEDYAAPFYNLPISGIIGDSQGALFAQHCFEPGMAKATYGTGTSILVHTGELIKGKDGLVTSLAWSINGTVDYAIEGIINSTGDVIKWLFEDLQLISDASETETLAKSIKDNEGVYFVPAFVGLGAPYWSPHTRAAVIGMNRNASKAHIVRAALESIAYQVKDIIELIEMVYDINIKELRVDGGATSNKFLMEFQADMLNKQVAVSNVSELSALGSAYLAGIGVGIWESIHKIKELSRDADFYQASISHDKREAYYQGWKQAVGNVLK